ncbi:helix-turn-helix domain-containing protein [Bifidobacterium stellenboschense]|uniref:MerR family regulatory protein n=1 Tax=Bifidobacterium stellenboschense TaxID=762211 RepID=A0A087DPQ3_9BIFI|nr:helix-turn-helix domain-containing protein [Bifidobacterium stellenboschense]KFI97503.1 MerR family regulatory protein [Bifidobacterium stellenboschense]
MTTKTRTTTGDGMMTVDEVACLLRISQRTVGRILDSGAIPFEMVGRTGRRMVAADDVLRFKRESERRRRIALEGMREAAEEIGMYDTPDSRIPTRTR